MLMDDEHKRRSPRLKNKQSFAELYDEDSSENESVSKPKPSKRGFFFF